MTYTVYADGFIPNASGPGSVKAACIHFTTWYLDSVRAIQYMCLEDC